MIELHLQNPSQPNRFHVDEMDNTNNIEWNKKRKSQTNQLDLHRPKHKCWIGNSSLPSDSEHDLMLDESPVFERSRSEAESLDNSSGPESAKDSNSFTEDFSNTTISVNEADSANSLENHEEHFLGLGNCTDKMFSEYAKENIEESIDKELEDIYHSKLDNPNTYVLSSGRWKVDQEDQSSSRSPTIDQEFEQYFSMLML